MYIFSDLYRLRLNYYRRNIIEDFIILNIYICPRRILDIIIIYRYCNIRNKFGH